ncbi:hypothetical protein [Flavicella sp.]|uniref:hypothetical protein n=1 Tax=Flavicella sp. TaxID=2957742 RepID=UPI0030164BFE
MENKQSNKLITIVLGILLILALAYTFYSNSEYRALQAELEADKADIKAELDGLVVKYDAKIAENTTMNAKLIAARAGVITYRDSLQAEKRASYSTIKTYRNKVYSLQEKNKKLLSEVDELTYQNEKLNEEVIAAKAIIETQEAAGIELSAINEVLVAKVAIASELEVGQLTVVSMKKRSSGALKETSRARYTDVFKVSFKIDENTLTLGGDKIAYIIIKDVEGTVIASKGKITNGEEEIYYSDTTTIDYQNIDTEVIVITDVNRKENIKGAYSITIILDGNTVGKTTITLK